MTADLSCSEIRVELSARLDQEVDTSTSALLDDHLATCAECRAHEEALRRVKRAVALQPAPQVRDLVPEVIARIEGDFVARRSQRRSLLRTALAAAVITGLVLSSAIVPWRDSSRDVALASEITRAVRRAATQLTSYHARFSVHERGWHERVPERRFTAEIWFESPENLRMEMTDLTDYPGEGWPTNDATLIASSNRWWLRETASCPAAALPGCEIPPEPEVRSVTNRQPFDGRTALPTDLILPLQTLADENGLTVAGSERVAGRDAHHVVLERWQAAPLIESLQVAGTWRRFPASARVDLWLDSETWFPLRFTVGSGHAALVVEATEFAEPESLDPETFSVPSRARGADGGFRNADVGEVTAALPAGLAPYRSGITRDGQRVATFVNGMTWLKVLVDNDARPTITTFAAELVQLDDDHYGYLEPSEDALRRTIEILGVGRRVRIESNLTRNDLLEVAASVPIRGREITHLRTADGVRVDRLTRTEADELPYASSPSYLPDGFAPSSAFVTRSATGTEQLTVYNRRPESASAMNDIRLIHVPDIEVLPPTSENLVSIRSGDLRARWSPLRSELDWLDGTTYRAVAVPAFDLQTAIRIARSLDR